MKKRLFFLLCYTALSNLGGLNESVATIMNDISTIDKKLEATVLAAGRSSRFKGRGNKQLAKMCGRSLLLYPLYMLDDLGIATHVVLNPQGSPIQQAIEKEGLSSIMFHVQHTPRGTGDAVASAQSGWSKEHILILNGDTPLVNADLVKALYAKHRETSASVTFVTCQVDDPCAIAYGRVIEKEGTFRIVEQKDCTPQQLAITRVNAGIYIVERTFLTHALSLLTPSAASGEIYITDIVQRASDEHKKVSAITVPIDRILGVNKVHELAQVERVKQHEINHEWMAKGVTFRDPHTTYVDVTATIGSGTQIGAGVHILGNSRIGKNCTIEPFSIISDSKIPDATTVHSFSKIASNTKL